MAEAASTATKALTCPNCGAPVNLRAAGYTVTVACEHCGSTLDALDPELKLIDRAQRAARTPKIPLGSRGAIGDITWEVVGYLERTDGEEPWSEYLLFNPYYGYRFLVDAGGEWTFGRLLDGPPQERTPGVRVVAGLLYQSRDEPYEATVTMALGEFYWRVGVGETVSAANFEGPSSYLSREQGGDEETWTQLFILPDAELRAAFGEAIFGRAPEPLRAAAGVPARARKTSPHCTIARLALVAIVVLAFVHPKSVGMKTIQVETPLEAPERAVSLGAYELPNDHNRVVVEAWGDKLDNAWIDIELDLVDRKTQQTYEGYDLVERYSGFDSDGYWAEGELHKSVSFSRVPKGTYDLVLHVGAHHWSGAATPAPPAITDSGSPGASATWGEAPQLLLSVKRGGLAGENLVFGLLAIVLPSLAISFANLRANLRKNGVID